MPAHGIGEGEIARCECAIDDRNEVSTRIFIRIPDAPLLQRNMKGREIALADQNHAGLRFLSRAE